MDRIILRLLGPNFKPSPKPPPRRRADGGGAAAEGKVEAKDNAVASLDGSFDASFDDPAPASPTPSSPSPSSPAAPKKRHLVDPSPLEASWLLEVSKGRVVRHALVRATRGVRRLGRLDLRH